MYEFEFLFTLIKYYPILNKGTFGIISIFYCLKKIISKEITNMGRSK